MSDGPSTGEVCYLHIALPDGRESARVEAEMVRMTPQGVGVRFIALLDDTAIRLGHFIGQAAARDEHPDPSDNPAVRSLRTLSQERLPAIFDQWIAYLIEALRPFVSGSTAF
ncbi:MAG: hypothetical protein ACUVQI_11135 [Thermochromatium sp.]